MLIKNLLVYALFMAAILSINTIIALESSTSVWSVIKKGGAESAAQSLKTCSLEVLQSRSDDGHGNSLTPAEFVALRAMELVPCFKDNPFFSLEDPKQFPNLYGVIDSLRKRVSIARIPELEVGGVVAAYEAADLLVKELSHK